MCEQCLTDMLSVTHFNDLYVGIARKQYYDEYAPGDVMVGFVNGPEMVIRIDLFTSKQWELRTFDWDEFHDHAENGWLWDYKVYCRPFMYISRDTLNIVEQLGPVPENHMFESWVVSNVGDRFQQAGIPLDKEGRLEWARQFGQHVNSMHYEGSSYLGRPELGVRYHNFEWTYYRPTGEVNEGGWEEHEIVAEIWRSIDPIPERLKPREDDEFKPLDPVPEDEQGPPYKYEVP